jgi:hypothetical protein
VAQPKDFLEIFGLFLTKPVVVLRNSKFICAPPERVLVQVITGCRILVLLKVVLKQILSQIVLLYIFYFFQLFLRSIKDIVTKTLPFFSHSCPNFPETDVVRGRPVCVLRHSLWYSRVRLVVQSES